MRTPEQKKESDRKYYLKNKEEHLAKSKTYYENNKEKVRDAARRYYQKMRPIKREVWNTKSRERYMIDRDAKLAWHKEHHKKKRIEMLERLGGAFCSRCGFSDWRALHIDHVKGGGNAERRVYGGMITRKKQSELIVENPDAYQVLCANCNFIKRYENGEIAKKRKESNK